MGEGFKQVVEEMEIVEATNRSLALKPDDQFVLAKCLASNLGYKLMPEDSIQGAEDYADVLRRLDRLETAVLELNPALNWP